MRMITAAAAAFLAMPLVALPGAAETISGPPMGWSSRALGCSVSESAVRQAADALAPLAPLGYRYVVIDGCWQAPQ
ncbi:alpha-galactosidase, partial [Nonomuraea aridisoli]